MGGGGGGRLCEAGRLLTFSAFSMGAYSNKYGKPLKDLKSFKDLGVTMSKDLSRDNHISITVNKANNQLELIKRFVATTNVNVFSTLYLGNLI